MKTERYIAIGDAPTKEYYLWDKIDNRRFNKNQYYTDGTIAKQAADKLNKLYNVRLKNVQCI